VQDVPVHSTARQSKPRWIVLALFAALLAIFVVLRLTDSGDTRRAGGPVRLPAQTD